jgi:hypothetical protein
MGGLGRADYIKDNDTPSGGSLICCDAKNRTQSGSNGIVPRKEI